MRRRNYESVSRSLTLGGAIISAVSAQLTWAKESASTITTGMPALYVSDEGLPRRGFDLNIGSISLGWLLVACGMAAAALLLWDRPDESNSRTKALQTSLGIAIVIAAILHISPNLGVIAAGIGGGLIIAGARLMQLSGRPK